MTMKVLIVDDQPQIRDLLRLVIDLDPRFEVLGEATNGGDAIELAADGAPDVIILDQRMPRVSGAQALPALRTVCPTATIVGYTADSTGELTTQPDLDGHYAKGRSVHALLDLAADLSERNAPGLFVLTHEA